MILRLVEKWPRIFKAERRCRKCETLTTNDDGRSKIGKAHMNPRLKNMKLASTLCTALQCSSYEQITCLTLLAGFTPETYMLPSAIGIASLVWTKQSWLWVFLYLSSVNNNDWIQILQKAQEHGSYINPTVFKVNCCCYRNVIGINKWN